MEQAFDAFIREPQLFLPVTVFSALLLGAGAFLIVRMASILHRRVATLGWISETVGTLGRCRIANWAELRKHIPRLDEPGLNADLDRIEADCQDMYHGAWIPAPGPYLRMRDVLPSKELWLFSREALVLPPAAGVALSAVSFLIAYLLGSSLAPDSPGPLALLCAVPTVVGVLLLVVYSLVFGGYSARVHAALAGLARSIERKVPVYSESTVMVTLLDSFLQYDRQMAAAVSFLDAHVESLASGALAKAVSQASEKMMKSSVAPALDHVAETMARVVDQLDRNQQEGMKLLAERFAVALAEDFRQRFEPVAKRMDDTAALLGKAEKDFGKTLELLSRQREEVAAIVDAVERSQAAMQKEREGFLTEISSVSANLNTLTVAADRMSLLYEGTESKLSGSIDVMSAAMQSLGDRVESTLGAAAEESRRTSEQSAAALAANQEHLDEMRRQIQILSDELANRIDQVLVGFGSVTGDTLTGFKASMDAQSESFAANVKQLLSTMEEESRSMSLYAKEIDVSLNELNETFRGSVAGFNQEMLDEVKKTLATFDEGLAEIVKRLSVSAAEIGDAVEALPQALRGIGGGSAR